jgi:hypothetical protein
MRKILLLLSFIFTISLSFAQKQNTTSDLAPNPRETDSSGKYYLFGTFSIPEKGKSYWCRNKDYELIELAEKGAYDAMRREFYKTHASKDPSPILITPNESFVIYRAKKRFVEFGCTYDYVAIMRGPSLDSARKKITQLFSGSKEILEPKEILALDNNSNADYTISEDYSGVRAIMTLKKAPGRAPIMIVKFMNTNPYHIANMVVAQSGKEVTATKIKPGEFLQMKMPEAKMFTIDIRFERYTPTGTGSIIDVIKEAVRREVTVDFGKVKSSTPGSSGIRG